MEIPIKIETIEKDIAECSKHLLYLKKTSTLSKELTKFVSDYNLKGENIIDSDITNAHCVTTIAQLEISLTLKSLSNSNHELENRHILKNGILIIYESIKSINNFNKVLNDYSNQNDDLKTDFEKYIYKIKTFKKDIDFDRQIKDIRNNTAGHINSNFVEYSKLIDSIDIEKTMNYLITFRLLINGLSEYLFKCMTSK